MTESLTNDLLTQLNSQVTKLCQEVGGINQRLDSGAELHKEMAQQIDMIDRRTDICETKAVSNEASLEKIELVLTPVTGKPLVQRIAELEIFQSRVGAMVVAAGVILGGAITLIVKGVGMLIENWSSISDGFKKAFH